MNAFNVRERNNAKTCQTFKQLSKLSLFVCSLRHGVKYKYKKEKVLQTLFTLVQMRGQASVMVDLACSKYQPGGDLNSDVNILTWLDLHCKLSLPHSSSSSRLSLLEPKLFFRSVCSSQTTSTPTFLQIR